MSYLKSGFKPLVLFGCIHIGFKHADLEYTKRAIKWVKKHDAMVALLGDNFENAIASPDKAPMMWDQDKSPNEQLNVLCEMLEPIKKQVVMACTSNHSRRSFRVCGIDLDEQLAHRLGYKRQAYSGLTGYKTLRVGNQKYRIVYTHGIGSGSNVLSDFRQLNAAYPNADLICASHTHTCLTTCEGFFDWGTEKRSIQPVTYVRTGSAIGYPNYADEMLYKPQPKGFSVVWLGDKEKKIEATTYFNFST